MAKTLIYIYKGSNGLLTLALVGRGNIYHVGMMPGMMSVAWCQWHDASEIMHFTGNMQQWHCKFGTLCWVA